MSRAAPIHTSLPLGQAGLTPLRHDRAIQVESNRSNVMSKAMAVAGATTVSRRVQWMTIAMVMTALAAISLSSWAQPAPPPPGMGDRGPGMGHMHGGMGGGMMFG